MWYVILQARSVPLYIKLYTVRLLTCSRLATSPMVRNGLSSMSRPKSG